ncbi:MAG: hypothetical protein WCW54_00555 [Candidatus Paceibacterota bacterium]
MRAYIKKLQSKSEETRKLIFVAVLILCMSFVSFIWIYNLGTRFGNGKVAEQTNKDIKPFQLFKNSLSDTFKNIGASVANSPFTNKKEVTSQPVNTKLEKKIDLIPVEYPNQ